MPVASAIAMLRTEDAMKRLKTVESFATAGGGGR